MDKLRYRSKLYSMLTLGRIERAGTGIPGPDSLIEGRIPKGFVVILAGPLGTDKTIFSLQFLLESVRNKELCIFFSFEEDVEQIIKSGIRFGWDLGKYIMDDCLEVFGVSILTSEEITEIIKDYHPTRVAFDSMNVFSDLNNFRHSASWRNLLKLLKKQ